VAVASSEVTASAAAPGLDAVTETGHGHRSRGRSRTKPPRSTTTPSGSGSSRDRSSGSAGARCRHGDRTRPPVTGSVTDQAALEHHDSQRQRQQQGQGQRLRSGFPVSTWLSQQRRVCTMETSVVFSRLTNITWISIVKGMQVAPGRATLDDRNPGDCTKA
jgi:hypothetical protein